MRVLSVGTWLLSAALAGPELCNGLDDDGDGEIDEIPLVFGADSDGDGAGSASTLAFAADCTSPPGTVPDASDCDDSDPSVFPGAPEVCNARDDDCDGEIDEDNVCGCTVALDAGSVWHVCDGDTLGWSDAEAACQGSGAHLASIDGPAAQSAAAALLVPFATDFWMGGNDLVTEGTWQWSDGTPFVYERWRQAQPDDGADVYTTEDCTEMVATGDWNDRSCEIPLPWLCERECTGTFFPDADGDGLGDPSLPVAACAPPPGHVANALDCDDTDDALPAFLYVDSDGDDYGAEGSGDARCPAPSLVSAGGDCDDSDPDRHPGADDPLGDGFDADCDGVDGEPATDPVDTGSPDTTAPSDTGSPPTDTTPPTADPPSTDTTPAPPSQDPPVVSPPEPPWSFGCGCAAGPRPEPRPWLGLAAWALGRRSRR